MNVKKTKKFKENRPENYHVHDSINVASPRTIPHTSILFLKIGRMVDMLVYEPSKTSKQSGSNGSEPGVLSRASMEMLMLTPTTSQ